MSDFIEVRQILAIVLRQWRIIALGVVLGAISGFLISRNTRPVYEATSTLLVGQSIQATNLDSSDIQIGEHLAVTYAAVGRRQRVLDAVVDELGLDMSWQRLRRQVHINPVDSTQLLEISVESTSPALARVIADEIARQMILLSPSDAPSAIESESQLFLEERLASLRQRIDSGQSRIEELEAEMASLTSASELRARQTEIDNLEQLITAWESNYAQLLGLVGGAEMVNHLTLMEEAEANPEPVKPREVLNTMIGTMLGLSLALGFIILREYLDDSVRTTDDVEHVLELAPLGAVSEIKGDTRRARLNNALDPLKPASEAFNQIRTNIRFAASGKTPGIILVTSAKIEEGKSFTVANLGVAMARSGLDAVIVDADLRRPSQHQIFEVSNESGLADVLRLSEYQLDDYLLRPGVESLWLLTSGTLPSNPSAILGSDNLELLLALLADRFDVVMLDAPPVLTAADAAIMSSLVDDVVMVVRSGRTTRRDARQALAALHQAGANVLGAVLNYASPHDHYYHYMPVGAQYDGETSPNGQRLRLPRLRRAGSMKGAKTTSNGRHDVETPSDAGA